MIDNWQPVQVLPKPAYGRACNGCGHCCIEEVCDLGRQLGDVVQCRALQAHPGGRFSCGLVVDPYQYLPADEVVVWRKIDLMKQGAGEAALKRHYADMLGAGKGCDSDD